MTARKNRLEGSRCVLSAAMHVADYWAAGRQHTIAMVEVFDKIHESADSPKFRITVEEAEALAEELLDVSQFIREERKCNGTVR